ncbi:MAG: hypothetical protein LBR13_05845, partial [Dysgonamonadaceae bacterium]|nr:hypothetical protein [Dysgonamonadaceae bacterium]
RLAKDVSLNTSRLIFVPSSILQVFRIKINGLFGHKGIKKMLNKKVNPYFRVLGNKGGNI